MKGLRLLLILLVTTAAVAQTRDPAALLRQAASLEAAKKWDAAAEAYSTAGDALIAAGRTGEAAAALKKAGQMSEQAADAILKGLAAPAQQARAPAAPAPAAQANAAPLNAAPQKEFESTRQCVTGITVRITPGPGAPNGGTGKVVPGAADDLMCSVAVDGGTSQRLVYWRLSSTDPGAKVVEHVKLAPGTEFKNASECTPGRAVTVGENLPYDDGGPGVVVKAVDDLSCLVTMTRTGKQNPVIYWRMAPQGAVAHYPDRIPPGNYGCGTFAGVVSLRDNIAGRVEARPLFDVHVTGPNSYTGSDGVRGTFVYDRTRGEVRFNGGTHNGRVASFLDNGGLGKFVFKSETGEIDCGL
jgi:hypothetical protein